MNETINKILINFRKQCFHVRDTLHRNKVDNSEWLVAAHHEAATALQAELVRGKLDLLNTIHKNYVGNSELRQWIFKLEAELKQLEAKEQ